MGQISQWVSGIAGAVMIVAAISAITPKNSAGKSVLLCGSFVITFMLVLPIMKLDISELSELGREFKEESVKAAEAFEKDSDILSDQLIKKEVDKYILKRAEEEGVHCSVDTDITEKVPTSVKITVDADKKEKIINIIETEIGVKRENIKIEE